MGLESAGGRCEAMIDGLESAGDCAVRPFAHFSYEILMVFYFQEAAVKSFTRFCKRNINILMMLYVIFRSWLAQSFAGLWQPLPPDGGRLGAP